VIGGLSTDQDTESNSAVPGLSKIPLLGELFKYHTKSRDRRSLMVFITPSIVHSSEDTELIFQNELAPPQALLKGEVENLLNGTSAIGGQCPPRAAREVDRAPRLRETRRGASFFRARRREVPRLSRGHAGLPCRKNTRGRVQKTQSASRAAHPKPEISLAVSPRSARESTASTRRSMSSPANSPPPRPPQLSIAQMLGVMRVEFHRARPRAAAVHAHDRGRQPRRDLRDALLAGKDAAIRAAYDLLKSCCKELGFFGMALMSGDRIMAVFPTSSPAACRSSETGSSKRRYRRRSSMPARRYRSRSASVPSHNLLAETNSSFEGLVRWPAARCSWRPRATAIATSCGARPKPRSTVCARRSRSASSRSRASSSLEDEVVRDRRPAAGAARRQDPAALRRRRRTSEIESLEKQILELAIKELYEERRKAVAAQMASTAARRTSSRSASRS
jgi:hypothetical protein